MSRELISKGGNYPPVVKLVNAGDKFVGTLLSTRDGNFGREFHFGALDGNAFIGTPDGTKNDQGKNNYKSVDVTPNQEVTVGTSKNGQLETKLNQAIVGEKVEITFNGKKLSPKTGRYFNDYTVKVLD